VSGAAWLQAASGTTPVEAWPAGDTGHARDTLLRAHPVLEEGGLAPGRLGRLVAGGTMEVERWWAPRGPVRIAAAAFADVARTARRLQAGAARDADVGVGMRAGFVGVPGTVRVDLAKGLRDGATALTVIYEP
jgi:hypothetical protein